MKLRTALSLLLAASALSGADSIKGNAFGNPAAPIMMEVFSDFQCPGCKVLHDTELPRLMKDYVIPGKVYLIYRYFPLDMHPYGRKAAEVVAAAAQLGKYEQAADIAFAKQPEWSATGKIEETVDNVLTSAEQQKLKGLLQTPSVKQAVEHDLTEGKAVPVPGTPTLLITYRLKRYTLGGREVLKYEWVKAMLDDLLSK
ncbi:MAG TPA: thioredoxin domain-containing protein [Candidatus Sulfopaludibacter sp.]|jgi:protein-disulfide isomerase|nr:thioredoxin domain-containing protein [Candidatus Sulfopaludibacter sp.]